MLRRPERRVAHPIPSQVRPLRFDALRNIEEQHQVCRCPHMRLTCAWGVVAMEGPSDTPTDTHTSYLTPVSHRWEKHSVSLVYESVVTVMVTRTTQSPLRHVII